MAKNGEKQPKIAQNWPKMVKNYQSYAKTTKVIEKTTKVIDFFPIFDPIYAFLGKNSAKTCVF